jgi:DNA mismatch repair protein MSH6
MTPEELIAEAYNARPSFLKEENIKDINGRRPSDPDYDKTTLFIPEKDEK